MPLYDARLDRRPPCEPEPVTGAVPFPYNACRVIDAEGRQVPYVLRCNTDTGFVERYDVRAGRWQMDETSQRPVVLLEQRPAPLRVEVREPGEPYLRQAPEPVADTPTIVGSPEPPAVVMHLPAVLTPEQVYHDPV